MNKTKIEWCDYSWNPIKGCSPISEGCANCYAAGMAHRFKKPWGEPVFHPELLEEPFRLRKPSRIFVCSVSDIFHAGVETGAIVAILDVVRACPHHTFMFLTKRPDRLNERQIVLPGDKTEMLGSWFNEPNIWLGVTAENQERAEERIPILLSFPAAVHFVSVEPMLGPVDIRRWMLTADEKAQHDDQYISPLPREETSEDRKLKWVICGPETGRKARAFEAGWLMDLSQDCADYGVAFFDKSNDDGSCHWRREYPSPNATEQARASRRLPPVVGSSESKGE